MVDVVGLWAIQLAFVISLACIPATLWLLASPLSPRARFAGCLALALLATHSFGHGLLLWPMVAGYVLLEPGGRRKGAFLAAWALAAALVLVPYFLSAGVHVRRDLTEARARLAAQFPAVDFRLAEPLGRHPLLLEVVAERARQALDGPATPSAAGHA